MKKLKMFAVTGLTAAAIGVAGAVAVPSASALAPIDCDAAMNVAGSYEAIGDARNRARGRRDPLEPGGGSTARSRSGGVAGEGDPRAGGRGGRTRAPRGSRAASAAREFLAQTGLRISEALALTKADVDFGRQRLSVSRRLYEGKLDAPKSRHGIRRVPLSPEIARRLWALLATVPDDAFVFANESGGPLDRSKLYHVVHAAGERAGIE